VTSAIGDRTREQADKDPEPVALEAQPYRERIEQPDRNGSRQKFVVFEFPSHVHRTQTISGGFSEVGSQLELCLLFSRLVAR
jgi:hypothetical protein